MPKRVVSNHATSSVSAENFKSSTAAQQALDNVRIFPALNDYLDAIEALPSTLARHFTQLLEVDARCCLIQREISQKIAQFFEIDFSDSTNVQDRAKILGEIQQSLVKMLPCSEEKVLTATRISEASDKLINRVEADLELIQDTELENLMRPQEPCAESSQMMNRMLKASISPTGYIGIPNNKGQALKVKRNADTDDSYNGRDYADQESLTQSARKSQNKSRYQGRGSRRNNNNANEESAPSTRSNGDDTYSTDNLTDYDGGKEAVYCYCRQVSYGQMIGCDGLNCPREWFHLGCIGLSEPPSGAWFCSECIQRSQKNGNKAKPKRIDRSRKEF